MSYLFPLPANRLFQPSGEDRLADGLLIQVPLPGVLTH